MILIYTKKMIIVSYLKRGFSLVILDQEYGGRKKEKV